MAVSSDKLAIINNALIATGNNPCATVDDGSPEWTVASMAFERWLPVLLRRRNWPFADTFADLTRVGASRFPGFSDVYAKPPNCLFLRNVFRTDLAALVIPSLGYVMPEQDTRPPPLEYRIVTDQVHCSAPAGATAIYVPFPAGAQPWTSGFVETLTLSIEAMIYRGLNEDNAEATRCEQRAEAAMQEEAARAENEEPRRMAYRPSVLERRRRRTVGGGYGSGVQGVSTGATGPVLPDGFTGQDFG